MSPLALIKRSTQKRSALTAAQMAHLRHSAYRGIETPSKPFPVKRDPVMAVYRGIPYVTQ